MNNLKPSNEVSAERRRAPRQRAFLRARISHLDGSISFEGSVTQISQTGARVTLSATDNLPERFRIEIPQRRIDVAARLVRRDAEGAAVAFEIAEAGASLMDRLRVLEAENRMLRATCEALTAQLENLKPY